MKTLAVSILSALLLGNFCAHATHVSILSRGRELCPSAVAVNTTTLNVNGNAIQRTTFECPDGSLSKRADAQLLSGRSLVPIPRTLTELSRRNVNECTTRAPECQCGQPTSCTCTNPTPNAPTGNDCAILFDSMKVIPQLEGPTFVVQPATFQLLQFESCAIEWSNPTISILRGQPFEFCWDEAVALMGLCNQDCLENDTSSGASCSPTSGLWNLSIFRISS